MSKTLLISAMLDDHFPLLKYEAPLFRDRREPLSPEANANQPGSQGCDS